MSQRSAELPLMYILSFRVRWGIHVPFLLLLAPVNYCLRKVAWIVSMLTQIGDVEIWRILESVDPFLEPLEFFPDMGEDGLALIRQEAPNQLCPETGMMLIPIQGFLIKTSIHTILVDACVGNDKTCKFHEQWHNRSGGRFLAGLTAAGVGPADVDYVLCTHLHLDHVGWNTRLENGRWVPTFPNARYIFPSVDNAHFSSEPSDVYNESVLPVIEAKQAVLVSSDHKLGDNISLISTPGHTPGHVSVLISDKGQEAVISGDAIHSTIQCLKPEWNFAYDHEKDLAARTRRALLETVCETDKLLLGSHFPLPSLGRVKATKDAFKWLDN
jgi:glyoxylase-like metal-dependent hydrolase (beta-lactamase superfamily II)